MKIKYKLHEEYNKHYGCTCCERGHVLLNKEYTVVNLIPCCKRMEEYTDKIPGYGFGYMQFDNGKYGHVFTEEDQYSDVRFFEYKYCPFCGEKVETECVSHIRDVPEFEKKMVERTRMKTVEEKYMVEKQIFKSLKQETII